MNTLRFAAVFKLALVLSTPCVRAAKVFINEIHYENSGADRDEGIEVAFPTGRDVSNYRIVLYNGQDGVHYQSKSLSKGIRGGNSNGKGLSYITLKIGMQDGGSKGDGIALVNPSNKVVQFLSYEGSFTARSGPAKGMTSAQIRTKQKDDLAPGKSLQLGGVGCESQDFEWQWPRAQTFGKTNAGQGVSCGAIIPVPPETPEGGDPFINEIHYERNSGEYIEVAYPQGTDIKSYKIELYEGFNGVMYQALRLSNAKIGSSSNGLTFASIDATGMHNGAGANGAGLALVDKNGEVVQFLSYEGTFMAKMGAAENLFSTDIGVYETTNNDPGTSLQLAGTGCKYKDFYWKWPRQRTRGAENLLQTVACRQEIPAPTPTTKKPTPQPTYAKEPPPKPGQLTYIPGEATVVENGLLLSTGLTARKIAKQGQKVQLAGGGFSQEKFHEDPDGASVFKLGNGGWVYVSNAESSSNGGVGALYFNAKGQVVDYKMLLKGSKRNCGGGKSFYGSWLSCEEKDRGQVWEVDPLGKKPPRETLVGGPDGDKFESAAYDNRDKSKPKFFFTVDQFNGAIRRYTPDTKAVKDARSSNRYWDLLHKNETGTARVDFLELKPSATTGNRGTFKWSFNLETARKNAEKHYPYSEGIDIRQGMMYVTCKRMKHLFILNLDKGTYERSSTQSGAFDESPDQVARLLNHDKDILYFCEDGRDTDCGVHGRDANGKFYTILQSNGEFQGGETTGLAFSPDKKRMYVSFQKPGIIYEIRRKDGYEFGGQRLDIKYHSMENAFNHWN